MFFHYNDLKCTNNYKMAWYKTTVVYRRHIVHKHNQKIAKEISMKTTVQKCLKERKYTTIKLGELNIKLWTTFQGSIVVFLKLKLNISLSGPNQCINDEIM